MKYRKGYKYQLAEDDSIQTDIFPSKPVDIQFITLDSNGRLGLRSGYASDGPSGTTIDTKTSIAGAFFHDALYELLRKGLISSEERRKADLVAYDRWVKDGMWKWRAKNWLGALDNFASFAADPQNLKKIYKTP